MYYFLSSLSVFRHYYPLQKNNPCQIAVPVLYYFSNLCWCGAMAAQLICNQWVAGSTPVTSSIQNPWIHLDPGIFLCRTQAPSCAKNDFLRKICARCRKNIVFVKKSSIIQATTTNRRENGMRHSLGTIAWRGLKGRRRDTAMMLCVLAAVFALLQRCCAISRAAAAPWRCSARIFTVPGSLPVTT